MIMKTVGQDVVMANDKREEVIFPPRCGTHRPCRSHPRREKKLIVRIDYSALNTSGIVEPRNAGG